MTPAAHRIGLAGTALCTTALYLFSFTSAPAHQANPACPSAQDAATLEAHAAVEKNPAALETRLHLADTYIESGCFDQALHVLEDGEALHPRNGELQSRLRTTRSMLSEQQYFEGLERAEQTAKLSRFLLRCNKLGDVAACNEALALKPDAADILSAKGDALMKANRPAEALAVYRHLAATTSANSVTTEKIAAAQAQRQAQFAACQTESGDSALQSCESALLRGADDEFAIHKRKAILLQSANHPAQALDSYIAANLLRNGDRSVALGIVALSESTGRKDALTLAARGSALLTLGRAMDALTPLRQALALAPGLKELQSQLRTAERLATIEARRHVAAAQSLAASAQPPAAPSAEMNAAARRYSNSAPPTRSN